MKKTYHINKKLRKKYIKEIVSQKPKYRSRRVMSIILYIVGVAVFAGVTGRLLWMLGEEPLMLVISPLAGFGLAIFPFSGGLYINSHFIEVNGLPFSIMSDEYLTISEEGVELGYHNTTNQPKRTMEVQTMAAEEIRGVTINENVLIIEGKFDHVCYDDRLKKRIDHFLTDSMTYKDGRKIKILLAFDEREEIVASIKKLAGL